MGTVFAATFVGQPQGRAMCPMRCAVGIGVNRGSSGRLVSLCRGDWWGRVVFGASGVSVPWELVGGASFWVRLVSLCRGALVGRVWRRCAVGLVGCVFGCVGLCCAVSCRVMSRRVARRVVSCRVVSRCVASRRVTSRHLKIR